MRWLVYEVVATILQALAAQATLKLISWLVYQKDHHEYPKSTIYSISYCDYILWP